MGGRRAAASGALGEGPRALAAEAGELGMPPVPRLSRAELSAGCRGSGAGREKDGEGGAGGVL